MKLFLQVIDTDRDEVLSQAEYRKFYKDFIGIPDKDLDKITQEGYRAMTAVNNFFLKKSGGK